MNKFIHALCTLLEKIAVISLLLLFLAVLAQIILRNVFNKGSAPLEEFSRYCSVSGVFLMIPVLAWKNAHIVVDMIINRLSEKLQIAFSVFSSLLSSGFMFFLLYSIREIMKRNWNVRTPGMRMLNAVYYIPITVGISAAFLVFVYQMGGTIKKALTR